MKKKLLALTLVFGLALSLAACSGGTQPGTADTPAPATDSPVPATGSPVAESDLAYLQDKGSLIIGYTVYEPMN